MIYYVVFDEFDNYVGYFLSNEKQLAYDYVRIYGGYIEEMEE